MLQSNKLKCVWRAIGHYSCRLYDIEVGTGAEASVGSRVAVHYEVKWRGITFMTSR